MPPAVEITTATTATTDRIHWRIRPSPFDRRTVPSATAGSNRSVTHTATGALGTLGGREPAGAGEDQTPARIAGGRRHPRGDLPRGGLGGPPPPTEGPGLSRAARRPRPRRGAS